MGIDNTHPHYDAAAGQWQQMRDVLAGTDVLRSRAVLYLPRPGGMDADDWNAYVQRPAFFNATARTLDGLTGAIFRKPPEISGWPEKAADLQDNVTGTGIPHDSFAQQAVREVIAVGRAGVIVDVQTNGGLPYMRLYKAEDIRNWRVDLIGGLPVLTTVVLREAHLMPSATDPYDLQLVETRLELFIDPETGVYTQRRWIKASEKSNEFVALESVIPLRSGEPLDFIPFQIFGPAELGVGVAKPPLLDLSDLNLSHWRTAADLEHGAHFTGLPTAWIAGSPLNDDIELKIGSGAAWMLDKGAAVGYLEFTGQGLGALERLMERKERLMAILGARLLEQRRDAVEAAESLKMRQVGETSIMAALAATVSRGLTNVDRWLLDWAGASSEDLAISLNSDFFGGRLSAQDLAALVSAWQGGVIGDVTLFHNLELGEMLPEGMTEDDFVEDRERNAGPDIPQFGR